MKRAARKLENHAWVALLAGAIRVVNWWSRTFEKSPQHGRSVTDSNHARFSRH